MTPSYLLVSIEVFLNLIHVDTNVYDIGHYSAFALVNRTCDTTSLATVIGSIATGVGTRRDTKILGVLKTHRTTGQGGTSLLNLTKCTTTLLYLNSRPNRWIRWSIPRGFNYDK